VLQTPLWSPDAASLYASYQAQRANGSLDVGIDRIDLAGGAWTRIVSNANSPALSGDGQYLAYAQLPSGAVRSFTLWRSAADGSHATQLIGPNVFVRYQGLRFSPDAKRLLFAAVGNGQGFSEPSARLPDSPFALVARAFQPPPAFADGDLWDLWSIDTDGHNLRRLTAINEDLPVSAWSPNGRAVAFLGGGSTVTAQGGVSIVDAGATAASAPALRLTVQPGHRGLDWTSAP
jgi:Tol biopolymer transport system component